MRLTQIEKIERQTCYDISVKNTNCFFVNGVLAHNSNGGLRIKPDTVQPQGRNRILDITSDNFGFAFFVKPREGLFRKLVAEFDGDYDCDYDITFYGEWAGKGIQKGVAVSEVDKHFVMFSAWDNIAQTYVSITNLSEDLLAELNEARIFSIYQVSTYSVTIDFNATEEAARKIEELTLQVEEDCPWGKFVAERDGVVPSTTTGEGIVWVRADDPTNTNWWFKSKGSEHQKSGKKGKTNVQVDTRVISQLNELAIEILPESRLEQGVFYLRENNIPVGKESTGQFLAWVCRDTVKEEYDTIANNGFEWKNVQGPVSQRARQWFFQYLDENFE